MKILLPLAVVLSIATAGAESLREIFDAPSADARTKVWWFHGETESTREGMDADLKAFKEQGVGGVVFYDQVHGKGTGAAPSMSAEWWDNLKYAALRAGQLGLSFEVAVSNGYVAGGPWITPDLAMKKTIVADTLIYLDAPASVRLPSPSASPHYRDIITVAFADSDTLQPLMITEGPVKLGDSDTILFFETVAPVTVRGVGFDITPRGKGSTGSMNIPGAPAERYFGAKYKEYPPVGRVEFLGPDGVWQSAAELLPVENNIGHKSGHRTQSFPEVRARRFRVVLRDCPPDGYSDYKSVVVSNITLYRRDITDNIEVASGLRTEVVYPHPCGESAGAVERSSIRELYPDSAGVVILPAGTTRVVRLGYIPTGARTKHGRKNLIGYEADVMSAKAANAQYDNYFHTILDSLRACGGQVAGVAMDSHEAGIQNWTEGYEERLAARGVSLPDLAVALGGYIVESRAYTDALLLTMREETAATIASQFYGTLAARAAADGVEFTAQGMLNIDTDNIAGRGRASKPQGEFWCYQTEGNYDCLDAASAAHLYGRPIASAEAFTDTPYDVSWDSLLRIANLAYCRGINEFVVCASSHQPWADTIFEGASREHPYVFHRNHPRWNESAPFWAYQARCAAMLRQGRPVVDLCVYIGSDPPLKTFAYRLPQIPEGYSFDVCTADALLSRFRSDNGRAAVDGGMSYSAIVVEPRTVLTAEVRDALHRLSMDGVPVIIGSDIAAALAEAGVRPSLSVSHNCIGRPELEFARRITPEADIMFVYNHSPQLVAETIDLAGNGAEIWNPLTGQRCHLAPDNTITLEPFQAVFLVIPH